MMIQTTPIIRITLPINLREVTQRLLSACNITGMYFVDFGDKEKTYQDVHSELSKVKRNKSAAAFNRFVGVAGMFPHGIRLVNRPPKDNFYSQTSTCISNLGVIDDWYPPDKEGPGNLSLVQAFGCAPLRPGTRMTFSFSTFKSVLTITLLADPNFFSREDSQTFLDRFMERLLK